MLAYILYSPLLLIFIGGSFATMGDIVLKKWADKGGPMLSILFGTSLGIYLIGIILLGWAFKMKGLAISNAIFVVVNAVSLIVVSFYYFHEKITLIQLFGITLAIIGVICIEFGG